MPHSTKGILAAFVATVVMSAAMLLQQSLGLAAHVDIIGLIDRLGSIGRGGAWADHVIVGTILWGGLFAAFDFIAAKRPYWMEGLIFGAAAWVAMMLFFMPFVGVGLFGADLGIAAPVVTLVMHLIYGLALGITFGVLDSMAPEPNGAGPADA